MCKKKFAIYVEGQTEQVLVNHLIKTWWSYSGVQIYNIKILSDQNTTCPVPNFIPDTEVASNISFLIVNVEGVGSLVSAIAGRADAQQQMGFEIIGLRDLFYPQDYEKTFLNPTAILMQKITDGFRKALEIKRCKRPEKIELFFAIMEIEAWLLAFPRAISDWARISEEDVMQKIKDKRNSLETIKKPSSLLRQIGESGGRNEFQKAKSYDAIVSIVHSITYEDILYVYKSNLVTSFNIFWDKLNS